jgi:hypothetical protein
MSSISKKVYYILKELFPLNVILKEHYVNYKGTRLFFDFFIKDLGVLIEVQGEQHTKFIEHFHEDKDGFAAQKERDNLKVEYTDENEISFVKLYYNEKITKDLVMTKIYLALNDKGKIDYE